VAVKALLWALCIAVPALTVAFIFVNAACTAWRDYQDRKAGQR
jgi:hypothetical protein